jgi:hypothetical protein
MFQVLKSPRDTEESRIKDLASHIHRSQFRFSNSNCAPILGRLKFVFLPNSLAALNNKPACSRRQVIRSKFSRRGAQPAFPEPACLSLGRGFFNLAAPELQFKPQPAIPSDERMRFGGRVSSFSRPPVLRKRSIGSYAPPSKPLALPNLCSYVCVGSSKAGNALSLQRATVDESPSASPRRPGLERTRPCR